MRATIDFGIDLGTTNSALAVAESGQVDVIKNNDNQEITPSAVQLLQNGGVVVGRKAYEHHRTRGDADAATGFKRQMGKRDQRYPFASAGIEKGPEDLAAEVLKSLRADAEAWTGQPVRSAVITVPAAFELAQCEATQRAARSAGFEQAPLLQEPIAAGLAYGYQRDLQSGYFVVYDLGGGTFDVTLLQIRDGRLLVVDHDGNNFLGGRDWDRRLAELLLSRLQAQGYTIWAENEPRGLEQRRLLEAQAEEEKIRLSRLERVDVVFDGRLIDADGRAIECAVTVTRAEYEALIAHDIERTIGVTAELLANHELDAGAIARIVPVGVPTLTPMLRQMLADRIGIQLDTRVDPMSVVARGAALFAAGVPLEPSRATSEPQAGALGLRLSYASVSEDVEVPVGGRLDEPHGDGLTIEIRRADGGWASGRLPLEGDAFFTTVVLVPRQANVFELTCFNASGSRVAIAPDRLAVTHGLAAADPPLSRSISVVALDEDGDERLIGMLDKGTALPAVRQRSFRTARELRPGRTGAVLNIHVIEGEHARSDLNSHVGRLAITDTDVGRPLPAGSPVDIKVRVDTSRGIVASAYIPLLDLTIENVLRDKYRPPIHVLEVEADLVAELARAREIGAGRPDDVRRLERDGADVERHIAAARAGDRDAADRADRALKEIKATVDRLEAETETERLVQRLAYEQEAARDVVGEYGDADERERLEQLDIEAERAIGSGDAARMRVIADRFDALYWDVLTKQPGFWVEKFIDLSEAALEGSHPAEADPLLARGREALDRHDIDLLRTVCLDLMRLLPRDEQPATGLKDVGIRS